MPEEVEHLWPVFLELHLARGSNGYGPNPISYAEIEAYSRVMKQPLTREEVIVLKRADMAYLSATAEHIEETTDAAQQQAKQPPQQQFKTLGRR